MNSIFKLIFLGWIGCLTLTSCSVIFGINSLKEVEESTILKFGDKYKIPAEDSYQMDTAYLTFLFSLDSIKYKDQIKNHYQPLQALYYKNDGQLHSFQVNCYAGGFPNLNWDRDKIMSTFPPREQAPIDSILPLDVQLKYLQTLSKTKAFSTADYDYLVIVYWNQFMGRQSKRLIRFVQENIKLSGKSKVKVVYVNTDNLYALGE